MQYTIYNFWLYVSIFTLICENTLLLYGQRRKIFIERQVMGKHLLGGKGTLIYLSNMLNASLLKAGKLLPLNQMCQEEHLKHFSLFE